jgi:hypothetical protein
MGYTKNGSITNFWPDNTDNEIYIASGCDSLEDLMQIAKDKWPTASMADINITSEKIHTSCITYDQYDGGDYTEFLVLTLNK